MIYPLINEAMMNYIIAYSELFRIYSRQIPNLTNLDPLIK